MSKSNTYWVGLDVHADKIQVAVYRNTEALPYEEYESQADSRSLGRLLKRLKSLHGEIRCVYEAGPCGYELHRYLTGNGIPCEITAPSLIPKKAGDRIKTDRRDARNLGQLYRSGTLTMIYIPDVEQEAIRDLVRAREDAVEDARRKKHHLGKFLLRHGRRYRDGKQWTRAHDRWLKAVEFDNTSLKAVFDGYTLALELANEQLARLTQAIEEISVTPKHQKYVAALMTLRGIQTVTAMTILSEIGDMRRFARARDFMAAIGLVPSEYSSGGSVRRGSVTKTGNVHVRRILVESAWHYRHRPMASDRIKKRRAGQPMEVVRAAQKADIRLYRKYRRMIDRGKPPNKTIVAIARELAGFIWAIGRQVYA